MISKKAAKYIKSLQLKKYRKTENAFIVEGAKSVIELFSSNFKIRTVFATHVFLKDHKHLFLNSNKFEVVEVSEVDLTTAGNFKSNNAAIAIVEMKENRPVVIKNNFGIALDRINDPGNLGTIIRIADWYGIDNIICSPDCADQYNPKVIAASMGSFTRINMFYTDLPQYLDASQLSVYGAYLEGENVHQHNFEKEGILLMGSESKGISPDLEKHVNHKISIPAFGLAESLNVAVATAIICDNIKR